VGQIDFTVNWKQQNFSDLLWPHLFIIKGTIKNSPKAFEKR
jgi:hypothetical protein